MGRRRRPQHNTDLLTAEEAGAMIGLGRGATYAAAKRGEIPVRRVGTRLLFSRRALQRWLAHEDESPSRPSPDEAVERETQ